jgi:hypothetical protein
MDDIEYCLKEIIDDATAMLDDCKSNTDPSSDAAARIIDQADHLCEAVDTFYRTGMGAIGTNPCSEIILGPVWSRNRGIK